MSRHHHRHKRGWAAIRARAIRTAGAAVRSLRSTWPS